MAGNPQGQYWQQAASGLELLMAHADQLRV